MFTCLTYYHHTHIFSYAYRKEEKFSGEEKLPSSFLAKKSPAPDIRPVAASEVASPSLSQKDEDNLRQLLTDNISEMVLSNPLAVDFAESLKKLVTDHVVKCSFSRLVAETPTSLVAFARTKSDFMRQAQGMVEVPPPLPSYSSTPFLFLVSSLT